MTTLFKIIALLLLNAMVLTSCSSDDNGLAMVPEPTDNMTATALTSYFEDLTQTSPLPGMAISIVKDGELVYQNAVGLAHIADNEAYTNQTITGIASISKTFVGAAVAKALEQELFTLETPINEVLPIDIVNLKRPDAEIKIKHLITHTSGIVDNLEYYLPMNYFFLPGQNINTPGGTLLQEAIGIESGTPVSLADYLGEYFLTDGDLYSANSYIDAAPGSTWAYSNTATDLMGYIIEYTSGVSFDDYVTTYILNPLQMHTSSFNILEVDLNRMATPYFNKETAFPFYGNHGYPEGSMHATNEDLGKYLLDMTKGIAGTSTTLFDASYYQLLFTPQLANAIVPQEFAENHGLFWYLNKGKWMHGGNDLGFSSHMEIAADGSYGFIVATNMDGTFYENETSWEQTKQKIKEGVEAFIASN